MSINLKIVTPTRKLLQAECENVLIPGFKGQLGVLPSHSELLSFLLTGVIVVEEKGKKSKIAVKDGFIQVDQDKIVVLASDGMLKEELDAKTLQEEKKDLDQKLLSPDVGIDEREQLIHNRDWLEAKLSVLS